eukprot:2651509-Pleurochrysis_carterae.AAC.2
MLECVRSRVMHECAPARVDACARTGFGSRACSCMVGESMNLVAMAVRARENASVSSFLLGPPSEGTISEASCASNDFSAERRRRSCCHCATEPARDMTCDRHRRAHTSAGALTSRRARAYKSAGARSPMSARGDSGSYTQHAFSVSRL